MLLWAFACTLPGLMLIEFCLDFWSFILMALRHSDSLPVSFGYLAVRGYDLRIARFSSVFVGALHGYWLILAISLVALVDILPMEAAGCS